MECFSCQGKMKRDTTSLDITRPGYQVHFDGLPAWICTECDEVFFEDDTVAFVERMLDELDEQMEEMREEPSFSSKHHQGGNATGTPTPGKWLHPTPPAVSWFGQSLIGTYSGA